MEKQKIISFTGQTLKKFENKLNKQIKRSWYLESDYDKNVQLNWGNIGDNIDMPRIYGYVLLYKKDKI